MTSRPGLITPGAFVPGSVDTPGGIAEALLLSATIKRTQEHSVGLNAEIAATNLPYLDDFTRTVDPGIGDSRYSNPDEAAASVNGSELRVDALQDASWAWSGAPRLAATYSFDFWVPAIGDTSAYFEVDTRRVFYEATPFVSYVVVAQSSPNDRWEYDVYGGAATISGTFTPDRETWYTVKWEVDPVSLQVRSKIWKTSDVEPDWENNGAAAAHPGSWSPFIFIAAPDAEEGRFDNLRADLWVAPPPSTEFSIDAVIASVPITIMADAIIKKTWTTTVGLDALVGHGGQMSIGSYFRAADDTSRTTHPRTGPHYGAHLDTHVISSQIYGALAAGTDLHEVLADLDARLTDLEGGN